MAHYTDDLRSMLPLHLRQPPSPCEEQRSLGQVTMLDFANARALERMFMDRADKGFCKGHSWRFAPVSGQGGDKEGLQLTPSWFAKKSGMTKRTAMSLLRLLAALVGRICHRTARLIGDIRAGNGDFFKIRGFFLNSCNKSGVWSRLYGQRAKVKRHKAKVLLSYFAPVTYVAHNRPP